MTFKLLPFLLLAGTVVGCASNPPPPPPAPVADNTPAPEPAPPPAPVAGKYTGTADQSAELPRGCHKMTRPVSVTLRANNTFTLEGIRGSVGPDGAISSHGRGGSLSGSATPAGMDVTYTKGKCTYHYMLTHA